MLHRTRMLAAVLLLAAIGGSAHAQSGVLKPGAEGRDFEIYADPQSSSFADPLASVAAQFAPAGGDIEGLSRMPRRTLSQSAAIASNQLGYETVQFADQLSAVFKPNRIIDNDWSRVANTKAVPYKGVCYIETTWPHMGTTIGTAFFVGRRVLLTNAHNLYDHDARRWARSIRVYPGRNGSQSPFGSDVNFDAYVPTGYTNPSIPDEFDYDIGWIVLPSRSLYNKVGYAFGFMHTTDAKLKTMNLNSAGYPGAKNQQQWRDFETRDQGVSQFQFRHYHDILGGSSGSPMYVIQNGDRLAAGINAWESTTTKVNGATRITKSYFDSTRSLKSQYP